MIESYYKRDQVYAELKEAIETEKYPAEYKFPRETEFARELEVSQVTLRTALKRLEEEGFIARVHGKGTFVKRSGVRKNRKILVFTTCEIEVESQNNYILPGIERRADELNVQLEKCTREFIMNMNEKDAIKTITSQHIDGIIFMSNSFIGNEKDYKIMKKSGLPVLLPHGGYRDYFKTGFATLRTNETEAFGAGIKHLVDFGHHRIGTVFSKISDASADYCRGFTKKEYLKFLDELGLESNEKYVEYCDYEFDDIQNSVAGMMNLSKPPTAIMCFSDFFAIHVYETLHQMKIKIPDHVAVMGYCHSPGGQFLSPPLSTVDLKFEKVGEMAVDVMLKSDEWWGKDKAVPYIFTPFEIIARESTRIKRLEKKLASA